MAAKKVAQLAKQLSDLQSGYDKETTRLHEAIDLKNKELSGLKVDFDRMEANLKEKSSKLSDLQKKVEDSNLLEFVELEEKCNQLEKALEFKQLELQNCKQMLESFESRIQELLEANAECFAECKSAKIRVTDVTKKLKTRKALCAALHQELVDRDETVANATMELAKLRSDHQKAMAKKERQFGRLQKAFAEVCVERDSLKERCQEAEREIKEEENQRMDQLLQEHLRIVNRRKATIFEASSPSTSSN